MAPRGSAPLIALVLFISWGYATHWVPILRWIGYALVTGFVGFFIALTALVTLSSRGHQSISRVSRSPRPNGPAILNPIAWRSEVDAIPTRHATRPIQICPHSPQISGALEDVLKLINKQFIHSWYNNISKDVAFENEVMACIRLAIVSIQERMMGLDLVDVTITRLVPLLTAHVRDFYEAEKTVRGKKLNRSVTESEELDLAIASKFRDGKLHPAASLSFPDTKIVQQDYLRNLVDKILPDVLPQNILASRAVFIILREVVACAVFYPLMQILSDPDTWNQVMENLGRSMLQDRSTVRRLRAALDQHASPNPKRIKPVNFPRLAVSDNERKFENFIRSIRKVNNLSDARRFRSEVASQLKRDSSEDNQNAVYLRRLEMGKRLLDKKVQQLAAGGDSRVPPQPYSQTTPRSSRLETASLLELLREPSALSYFMEFMDRQHLMSLVQFWLVVDGFRNPLEDDGLDEELPATLPSWTSANRLDLQQIEQAYLSKPELKVSDSSKELIHTFLRAGNAATPLQYYNARRAILAAQSAVLEEMQSKHFGTFKKSDLFYKCLTSQEASQEASNTSIPLPAKTDDAIPSTMVRPPMRRPHQNAVLSRKSQSSWPTPRLQGAHLGSSSDVKTDKPNITRSVGDLAPSSRPALDSDSPNPLFDDDEADLETMLDSVHSLDQEPAHAAPDTKVVQAMEHALNSIMEDERPQTAEDLRASLFGHPTGDNSAPTSRNNSMLSLNLGLGDSSQQQTSSPKDAEKPSLASLGLVSAASRIGVFVDDDLFEDEDKYISDGHESEGETTAEPPDDIVHEAAPGDLGLAEAITALTNDIDKLIAQDAVVESLTNKAELTNNSAELRILRKSKASLQREIRRKELQRQQYVIQESDNSLYGRSTIRIKSIEVGKDEEGKEFVLYVVEVQRNAGEQIPAASWLITRRYSEFHELHQKLRSRYPSVRNLEFPRRRMVMKFQSEFLKKRRLALEKYLQELLLLPDVCRSRDLRAFLSQRVIVHGPDTIDQEGDRKDMISRLYDSVTDGVEDILGNIPVLDQLSLAGQNLIAAATSQMSSLPAGVSEDGLATAEAEAELNAFENKELEPFIKPICDIFLEVFELNRGNNWLRGRAVVVVLQQLLGGTIERKVRESMKGLAQEEAILRSIDQLRNSLWPGGEVGVNKTPRTAMDKKKSCTEASMMLATLVPDLAGGVVGRLNAQAASRRIFATLNNTRLNSHLAFTLLDVIIDTVFRTP